MADEEEVSVLRLHVGPGGRVWSGRDGVLGDDSGTRVDDFLGGSAFVLGVRHVVRLFGIRSNAALICRLYERRLRTGRPQRVEACSPVLASAPGPLAALQSLLQPEASSAACVCCHDVTEKDYTAYLIAESIENDGQVGDKVLRALPYHPAWPALSFLPSFSLDAAVRLLNDILDPRWFRNPRRPGRINKLLDFLGVDLVNAFAVLSNGKGTRNWDRAWPAFRSWYVEDLDLIAEAPHNFLWRVYKSTSVCAAGMLRACRRFVRFVYEVWMGELCHHKEAGFSPKLFFKRESEQWAYEAHRAALR